MTTCHELIINDARKVTQLPKDSVDLLITSPPYPMIAMWDDLFGSFNTAIKTALAEQEGNLAFELMHKELDMVWEKAFDLLKEGGLACINIGDATRNIDENFRLFANHARILNSCQRIGFSILPLILWRKPTNSPTKFMGSGMLPGGAYVTLEHEYILIMRKGKRKKYNNPVEKKNRNESAIFWEERNLWYSDLWNGLPGVRQNISNPLGEDLRARSAAFPFELAYRLINMFSTKNSLVFDPFVGTGTTIFAAMCSERNSVGLEIDNGFSTVFQDQLANFLSFANDYIKQRFQRHLQFVKDRQAQEKIIKYQNNHYSFPVVTSQERDIKINELKSIQAINPYKYIVDYD